MAQCKTKRVTYKQILNSKAFNLGVEDVRKGRPFRYDIPEAEEWNYIRGRHFAQIYRGPIKAGRSVRYDAIVELHGAWVQGAII